MRLSWSTSAGFFGHIVIDWLPAGATYNDQLLKCRADLFLLRDKRISHKRLTFWAFLWPMLCTTVHIVNILTDAAACQDGSLSHHTLSDTEVSTRRWLGFISMARPYDIMLTPRWTEQLKFHLLVTHMLKPMMDILNLGRYLLFSRSGTILSYLARAAYWVYVAHVLGLFTTQMLAWLISNLLQEFFSRANEVLHFIKCILSVCSTHEEFAAIASSQLSASMILLTFVIPFTLFFADLQINSHETTCSWLLFVKFWLQIWVSITVHLLLDERLSLLNFVLRVSIIEVVWGSVSEVFHLDVIVLLSNDLAG